MTKFYEGQSVWTLEKKLDGRTDYAQKWTMCGTTRDDKLLLISASGWSKTSEASAVFDRNAPEIQGMI